MTKGSVVIANDLLGIVDDVDENYVYVVDACNKVRKVIPTAVNEVTNPHALAALLYLKVVKRVQSNR